MRHLGQGEDFKQATDTDKEIIIDGIEVPCVRPGDPEQQKTRYSGKKRHMLKVLIITNHARKILYLSPLFNGSTHDYAMMTASFAPTQPWFKDFTLRADLGFLGAPKDYRFGTNILLPHKKPRQSKNHPNPSLTEQQETENRAFSKIRVPVEHAIGGMKHFHCLTHRIRQHSMSLIDQFFGLSAGLWNFKSFTINSFA